MLECIKKLLQFKQIYFDMKSEFEIVHQEILKKIQDKIFDLGYTKDKDYIITSRVKEPDSLYEKCIRKNMVKSIMNNSSSNQELKKFIIENDFFNDIIGIKIKTLIKEPSTIFGNLYKSIKDEFSIKESFDDAKTAMKNGLDFFKVYGQYKKYQFELQCSTIIQSAWSDIEHRLFYKDYIHYFEKDNNQKIISHIKNSLIASEEILRVTDDTRVKYQKNYQANKIRYELSDSIENQIIGVLKTTVSLDSLYELFDFIAGKEQIPVGTFSDLKLTEESFNFKGHNRVESNIINLIQYNFKMMIEFAVLNHWQPDITFINYFEYVFELLELQRNLKLKTNQKADYLEIFKFALNNNDIICESGTDFYTMDNYLCFRKFWIYIVEYLNNVDVENSLISEIFLEVFNGVYGCKRQQTNNICVESHPIETIGLVDYLNKFEITKEDYPDEKEMSRYSYIIKDIKIKINKILESAN